MPVVIAQNIAVAHDTEAKDDIRRLTSRRKSRLTVYLTTSKETQEDDFSIFNETCVQSLLEEQQERKQKVQRFEKLRLVWKGTYTPGKSTQEAFNEFLANRCSSKCKLRLNTNVCGNYKTKTNFTRRSIPGRRPNSSSVVDTSAKSSEKSRQSTGTTVIKNSSRSKEKLDSIFQKNEYHFINQLLTDRDAIVHNASQENSSITHGQYSFIGAGKRLSRSIFNTKRATDNQEHNMFSYRTERKRPVTVVTVKTSDVQTKKDSTDSLLKAITKMQLKRKQLVPESVTKVEVDTILRAFLSEQFLELNLEGSESFELRRMYIATILSQPVIYNLIMKHPDMIPSRIFSDLVNYKKGFEVNPIYAPTVVKIESGSWRQTFHRTLSSPTGTILIELENDMPLFANFYKTLIEKRSESVTIDACWLKERKPQTIRENLHHMAVNLRIGRHNPGSTVRFDIIQLFIAAGRNDRLLRHLGLTVEGWLDQLVKGLYSPFKSVREETCQVLCYMTSNYPVMRELYLSKYFDVVQDLSLTILRAIDQFEDTFSEYYILLAHIIHYCPSRSILDCIVERWMNFRSIGMVLRWPRLVYYALRYWPDDALCLGSRLFSIRVTRALENALQRPITAKVSRCALYYLQVRFNNVSSLFSVYYDKESAQSRFMNALNI